MTCDCYLPRAEDIPTISAVVFTFCEREGNLALGAFVCDLILYPVVCHTTYVITIQVVSHALVIITFYYTYVQFLLFCIHTNLLCSYVAHICVILNFKSLRIQFVGFYIY